jgi:cardiolipin synthase
MDQIYLWATIVFVVDLAIRLGLSVRIIMRRRPVGVTFAWLAVVMICPFLGAISYLMFGELRLGNRRAEWARVIHDPFKEWVANVAGRHSKINWAALGVECEPLSRLSQTVFDVPPLPGNQLELLPTWEVVFERVIGDIDAAKRTCHLEFYIWSQGGFADEVAKALMRAAQRGVICRMLLDDVGSRRFLRSPQAKKLRDAGVHVQAALPAGLFRMLFYRADLRQHRKIVVIDGEVAYTGSLNMVDPRYFKKDAGVGEWVDAMVRVVGPAVESLGVTFLEDWELETSEGIDQLRETGDIHELAEVGESVVQSIPSGPVFETKAIQDVLMTTIYGARQELILTSPYFVPDEVLAGALATAARRGVDVTILVPAKVDSFMVRYASQAYKGDLLQTGVKIALFHGGLLHTKSVTVDGEYSLFGSLNLDPQSLYLNFEITLAVYDATFTRELRELQLSYVADSTWMEFDEWQRRPMHTRLQSNAMRLLSPLL